MVSSYSPLRVKSSLIVNFLFYFLADDDDDDDEIIANSNSSAKSRYEEGPLRKGLTLKCCLTTQSSFCSNFTLKVLSHHMVVITIYVSYFVELSTVVNYHFLILVYLFYAAKLQVA